MDRLMNHGTFFRRDDYLRLLEFKKPDLQRQFQLEVIRVTHHTNKAAEWDHRDIAEPDLGNWLHSTRAFQKRVDSDPLRAQCRYILGPARLEGHFPPSRKFPGFHSYETHDLPLTKYSFSLLMHRLQLPAATPWLLAAAGCHFQKYEMDMREPTGLGLGFTMRLESWGIIEIDTAVSVSYHAGSGGISVLLHGCSRAGQQRVATLLKRFYSLTIHPLLLPTILAEMKLDALGEGERILWNDLVRLEGRSGQTGAPEVKSSTNPTNPIHLMETEPRANPADLDFDAITIQVLGIIQMATYAESHLKSLLLIIQAMQKSIEAVYDITDNARKQPIGKIGDMLREKLDVMSQSTEVGLADIQFIIQRAQAQQSAVYNYIAQVEARNSSRIALAAKRDSSAMKSIAVLTILFLPGTCVATFFAMPVLDFTKDSRYPSLKDAFWLYWAVSIPLTCGVFGSYVFFEVYTQKQHSREDRMLSGQSWKTPQQNDNTTALASRTPVNEHV